MNGFVDLWRRLLGWKSGADARSPHPARAGWDDSFGADAGWEPSHAARAGWSASFAVTATWDESD